jgi:hypothetical protein
LTLVADVPPPVVTVTSTVLPIELVMVGVVAVIVVLETTVTPLAAALPKWTAVAPVKLDPVMVTVVPPGVVVEAVLDVTEGAATGLTAVTTGPDAAAPAGDAARNPRAGAMRTTAARAPTFARDFIVSFHRSFRILRPIPLHTRARDSSESWGIVPHGGPSCRRSRSFPISGSAKQGVTGRKALFSAVPISLPASGRGADKIVAMSSSAAVLKIRFPSRQ